EYSKASWTGTDKLRLHDLPPFRFSLRRIFTSKLEPFGSLCETVRSHDRCFLLPAGTISDFPLPSHTASGVVPGFVTRTPNVRVLPAIQGSFTSNSTDGTRAQ